MSTATGASISEALRLVRELISSYRSDESMSLADQRASMDAAPQPLPDGVRVEEVTAGGVPGRVLTPCDAMPGRSLLFLHGGGYRAGSSRSHLRLAGLIASATRAMCLSVDYRLAPEHPHPAAIEDAVTAFQWLQERSGVPTLVCGDSAGGGLALALLVHLRDRGADLPAGAALLAPWLDLTCSGASFTELAAEDVMLDGEALRASAAEYAGNRTLDPAVSPLFADLTGLPAICVQVGGADLLRDDAVRLAARAASAGVDITLEVAPGLPHVYHAFAGLLPDADAAIERIGGWLDRVLG